MVWCVDLGDAGRERLGGKPLVGGNGHAVGNLGRHVRIIGIAVAVGDQPRIDLQDQLRAKEVGELSSQRRGADVPGDVPRPFGGPKAQIAESLWNASSGMVANQQNGGAGA